MSMKNSNDTIGNQTRDLLACSAIPNPNAPPRVPSENDTLYVSKSVSFWHPVWRLGPGSNLIVIRNPGVFGGGGDSRLLLTALDGKQWSDGCPGFEYRQVEFAHWQIANNYAKWGDISSESHHDDRRTVHM
jgi:hypothetical protein